MALDRKLFDCARSYSERFGWALIPVKGKVSACAWKKYQLTRPGEKHHYALFSMNGVTGLAVLLGKVSDGLCVRDFDTVESYHYWASAHPDLAAVLPTSQTRRGFHVYFRASQVEKTRTFTDGEFRAERHYVILPPSLHPDGVQYVWTIPPCDTIPLVDDIEGSGLLSPRVEGGGVPATVDEAIKSTLPNGVGHRNRSIWNFGRRLKAIEGLDVSPAALASYIEEWHRQALPRIRTKEFAVTDADFYSGWNKSNIPLSDEQFTEWAKQVLEGPEPEFLQETFFPKAGKLLWRICAALQEKRGDNDILLAARVAANIIGVEYKTVSSLFKLLVEKGSLVMVKKGCFRTGKGTTWRYTGPSFSTEPVVLADEHSTVEQAVAA